VHLPHLESPSTALLLQPPHARAALAAAKFAPQRGLARQISGRAVDWRKRVASLPHSLRTANQNVNFVLPILVLAIPVLAIVLIAICSGRRLSGSCGALGPDGKCARCGVAQPDVERLRAQVDGRSCP
jgi:hypothetical protein